MKILIALIVLVALLVVGTSKIFLENPILVRYRTYMVLSCTDGKKVCTLQDVLNKEKIEYRLDDSEKAIFQVGRSISKQEKVKNSYVYRDGPPVK